MIGGLLPETKRMRIEDLKDVYVYTYIFSCYDARINAQTRARKKGIKFKEVTDRKKFYMFTDKLIHLPELDNVAIFKKRNLMSISDIIKDIAKS